MASTTTTTTTAGTTADIDALLTTYLELLHTYTTLRSKLTALQSSTSLSLARANFSTPHQMGYTSGSNSKLRASVRLHVIPPDDDEANGSEEEGEGEAVFTLHAIDPEPASKKKEGDDTGDEDEERGADDEEGEDIDPTPSTVKGPPPLPHIFGVLAPPSLREAQASAIDAVQMIVELAGVKVRMRGLEVEVRRARKRALRAEKGR
ncbi:hypothetical protein VE01_06804 [Pseudogymnoascus verrucosus]|uniref:Vacuolar ATPase assembly protein VMA22 n=1 Tax=Pseudogymnoascus verrucosus TaxID=342668 RepID=A0A1B8GJL1_9PEZI|nr:uncharacterized protein VE01_06804 [Pseudogymnoascus verrucosus]OBT96031.1 hypothetical protein VE01_06804 [Pseudogymnoascus verrucosus]